MPKDAADLFDLLPPGSPEVHVPGSRGALATDILRRRGTGCANPALGCSREAYTTSASSGYLRSGYDSGRWWVK